MLLRALTQALSKNQVLKFVPHTVVEKYSLVKDGDVESAIKKGSVEKLFSSAGFVMWLFTFKGDMDLPAGTCSIAR